MKLGQGIMKKAGEVFEVCFEELAEILDRKHCHIKKENF